MTDTPEASARPPGDARRARVAVGALFFTNGAIMANLLPRYPEIKAGLGLANVEFGAAVAAFPLGALVAGLSAGVLIRRFRSSRVAVSATALAAIGFVVIGAAPNWAVLASGMCIAGAMDAITDVAQNSHGLRVQRRYGRSILNAFHAVWSAGAVLGGLMGAVIGQAGVPVLWHMVVSASLFAGLALLAYRWLLPGPEPVEAIEPAVSPVRRDRSRAALLRTGVLVALVVIAASGGIVEDAGASWAAIYLAGDLGASTLVASFGFIALQGAQFVGRMLGDALVDRFGQRAVARTGGVLVLVGMGAALAFPSPTATIAGFAAAGLGIATLIPAAMHGADTLPGLPPGAGLTIVSWLLRLGFLGAPLIVGAVADVAGLRTGLLIVPVVGLLVVVFAQVLSAERRAARLDVPEATA